MPCSIPALVLALAAPLVLGACGRDATAPTPAPTPLAPTTLQMAGGVPLLALASDAAVVDTAERRRLAELRAAPWAIAVHVARLAVDPDTVLRAGRAVAFDVNPTARLVFVGDRRTPNPATRSLSWHGTPADGVGDAHVVLTTLGVTATLAVAGPAPAAIGIQPLGPSGLHAVVQVDPRRFPPD